MVEREIRSVIDVLEWLRELSDIKNIGIGKIETEAGISQGYIARWKNFSPSLNSVLKVLSVLDAKMVLCTDELEEEHIESESENAGEAEMTDAEYSETEISELDMLILDSAKKALKNCNSRLEKERLCRILQAFF